MVNYDKVIGLSLSLMCDSFQMKLNKNGLGQTWASISRTINFQKILGIYPLFKHKYTIQ